MHHLYKNFELSRKIYFHESEQMPDSQVESENESDLNNQDEAGLKEVDKLIASTQRLNEKKDIKIERMDNRMRRLMDRGNRLAERSNDLYKKGAILRSNMVANRVGRIDDRVNKLHLKKEGVKYSREVSEKDRKLTQELLDNLKVKTEKVIRALSAKHSDPFAYELSNELQYEILSGSLKADLEKIYDLRSKFFPVAMDLIVDGHVYQINLKQGEARVGINEIGKNMLLLREKGMEVAFQLSDYLTKLKKYEDDPEVIRQKLIDFMREGSIAKTIELIMAVKEAGGSDFDEVPINSLMRGDHLKIDNHKYRAVINEVDKPDIIEI